MKKETAFLFNKIYNHSVTVSCNATICLPLIEPFKWLSARLLLSQNIPIFAEKDFLYDLKEFIDKEEESCMNDRIGQLYKSSMNDNQIVAALPNAGKHASNTITEPPTDEEIFGQIYTNIIQSPAATDLIQLEQSFAVAVETEVIERNRALRDLQQRIINQTEVLLTSENQEINLADAVSELQRRFHSEYEVQKMTWNSRISDLKEIQRRDYRNFLMSMDAQTLRSKPQISTSHDVGSRNPAAAAPKGKPAAHSPTQEPRSESFLVQLGRQLRSFYNLKLVEADPMELMTAIGASGYTNGHLQLETTVNRAERLSSALTIYSNELTALVILVDRQMLHSRDQQRLADVCELSTDFHFPEFDRQIAEIKTTLQRYLHAEDGVRLTNDKAPTSDNNLHRPGDVYVTRHSNLQARTIGGNAGGGGGVGVVFHVVDDGATVEGAASFGHRCPSYLHAALSAVLRTCLRYDITTLSMPLLFVRRLSEKMTLTWCYRRAEAVLKAVKGSLMELTSLRGGGSEVLRTIIFLVSPPQEGVTAGTAFDAYANLVGASFQLANPIVLASQ